MKYIFILLFFYSLSHAEFPRVYSSLGDVIYMNVDKIERLSRIKQYKLLEKKISDYVLSVYKTKEYGYLVEKKDDNVNKLEYLNQLREINEINSFFIRSAENALKSSIENDDTLLFAQLINTGIIDRNKFNKEIDKYLLEHNQDIDILSSVENFKEINSKKDIVAKKIKKFVEQKNETPQEKLKRVKQKYQAKHEALIRELEYEVVKKKIKIREQQRDELVF